MINLLKDLENKHESLLIIQQWKKDTLKKFNSLYNSDISFLNHKIDLLREKQQNLVNSNNKKKNLKPLPASDSKINPSTTDQVSNRNPPPEKDQKPSAPSNNTKKASSTSQQQPSKPKSRTDGAFSRAERVGGFLKQNVKEKYLQKGLQRRVEKQEEEKKEKVKKVQEEESKRQKSLESILELAKKIRTKEEIEKIQTKEPKNVTEMTKQDENTKKEPEKQEVLQPQIQNVPEIDVSQISPFSIIIYRLNELHKLKSFAGKKVHALKKAKKFEFETKRLKQQQLSSENTTTAADNIIATEDIPKNSKILTNEITTNQISESFLESAEQSLNFLKNTLETCLKSTVCFSKPILGEYVTEFHQIKQLFMFFNPKRKEIEEKQEPEVQNLKDTNFFEDYLNNCQEIMFGDSKSDDLNKKKSNFSENIEMGDSNEFETMRRLFENGIWVPRCVFSSYELLDPWFFANCIKKSNSGSFYDPGLNSNVVVSTSKSNLMELNNLRNSIQDSCCNLYILKKIKPQLFKFMKNLKNLDDNKKTNPGFFMMWRVIRSGILKERTWCTFFPK